MDGGAPHRSGMQEPEDGGRYVASLADFGRQDVDEAGGKGANLGELVRAGFPVPSGFVVTTAAYDLFLSRTGLAERIPGLLTGEGELGAAIRTSMRESPVPPEVVDPLLNAYRRLGRGAVAVRSSATAEDLPQAAFAGQQETYLNVVGETALLEAVRRCWASLWSERAIAYRSRHRSDAAPRIAVVVQEMVEAVIAGVLFTANPVTGVRDEVVIDASPGLGEAVVSGRVTPDHFVLSRRTRRVKEWTPGRREVVIRALPGGGTQEVTGAAGDQLLPARAVRKLARVGMDIERLFGRPQDVEWALTGGDIHVLQARPITALPEPSTKSGRMQRQIDGMMAELFAIRPYPLDVTTWTSALFGAVTGMFAPLGLKTPSFEELCVEEDGVLVRLNPRRFRPSFRTLAAPLWLLRQARRYNPATWQNDSCLAELKQRTAALEAHDLQTLSWDELVVTLDKALAIPSLFSELRIRYLPRPVLAGALLRVVLQFLRRGDRFGALMSGVPTKTSEVNRSLEALAGHIRSDPALARVFREQEPAQLEATLAAEPGYRPFFEEVREFLDHYGHREKMVLLASQPTWKDAPQDVLALLKSLAATPPLVSSERREHEAAKEELLRHPLLRLPPLRGAMCGLLQQARLFVSVREDTHFYGVLPLPVVRRTMLELGRRLDAAGVLQSAEDVFHLRLEELERVDGVWPPPVPLAQDLRMLVERREAKRASLPPLVDPALSAHASAGPQGVLRGTPGSPGVAEGRARIIRDASQFGRLQAGDVLVAPYTNPAWTPLFQRASAVVVDSGSAGSHAAIVAREYGIPAVMATGSGTNRLIDGRRVRVDGSRGLVFAGEFAENAPGQASRMR